MKEFWNACQKDLIEIFEANVRNLQENMPKITLCKFQLLKPGPANVIYLDA